MRSGTTADLYSINAAQQTANRRAGRRRRAQQRVFRDRLGSRRLRSGQSKRLSPGRPRARRRLVRGRIRVRRHSRSIAPSITIPRARSRRSASSSCKSTPARRPRTPRRRASPASSIRSSRPEPFPATPPSNVERSGRRPSITASTSKPAARRPIACSRTTSASAATIRITATSISSAARRTPTSSASSSAQCPAQRRPAVYLPVVLHQRQAERRAERHARAGFSDRSASERSTPPTSRRARSVVNLHIGIPHKNDGLRDDVQLLYDNDEIFTTFLQLGQRRRAQQLARDGRHLSAVLSRRVPVSRRPSARFLPLELSLAGDALSLSVVAAAPVRRRRFPIPYNQRDRGYNGQAIVKLQYQKNFSSERVPARLRLHVLLGLDRERPDDVAAALRVLRLAATTRSTTTRAASALAFTDQLNPQNLLEVEGSYTTSTGARIYNEQMFQFGHSYGNAFAVLVNRNDPFSGTCYRFYRTAAAAARSRRPAPTGRRGGVTYGLLPTFLAAEQSGIGHATAIGATCGGGPCAYYVVENGAYGLNNTVTPYFTGYSLTDQWRPSDRLFFNFGVRVDNYSYVGANTDYRRRARLLVQRVQSGHVLRHRDADAGRPQRAARTEQLEHELAEAVLDLRQPVRQREPAELAAAPSTTTSRSRASA